MKGASFDYAHVNHQRMADNQRDEISTISDYESVLERIAQNSYTNKELLKSFLG